MKKGNAMVVITLVLAAVVGLSYYASLILTATGAKGEMAIPLGLDLSGGVSITYQIVDENPTEEDMSDTIYKLQKRVEGYSTESTVYQVGEDRITVEIPGVSDANMILEELGNPGSLQFTTEDGDVFMTGEQISNAEVAVAEDLYGNKEYVVALTMTDEGAKIFAEVTKAHLGRLLPIIYDGEVISEPYVQSVITGGQAQISNMGSYEEANLLATQIRVGSLSLELQELESSVVGAQLGSQAISTSLKAAVIGLLLVMLFMIVMYRVPGVAASVALVVYTTIVIAILYLYEITLTLPGIAGIILGIGMAVDANVIVFSRIREEIADGMSVMTSIKAGFQKAMSAILDGNITTFIAALVLMGLGSGSVKGFAYTLMIGILVSMFSAMVVTRYVLYALYGLGFCDEKFYGREKEKRDFDFIGKKALFFGISIVCLTIGIVTMGINQVKGDGALNFGLDFVGGTSTTVDFGVEYSIEAIEETIIPEVAAIIASNNIQANKVETTTKVTIKTPTLSLEQREAVNEMLISQFGVDAATIECQNISSLISSEMRSDAIVAVIVSCVCMLIYIWFRFSDIRFAASAILALVHDVLIVVGVYGVLRISVGNTFIACILTIVGYSINDTIVIFDRIRENLAPVQGEHTPEILQKVANCSLSQTLSRSINTSITTFIMVLMLYILGVASIRDFALPLMAGLISGAYSSACIATQFWYVLKKKFPTREVEEY
ncbi:MAG: protein translocase subunit SecD [Lachnospiraceae bacterium]|nr:protein translocase subunit SecD [Lachnospiraceae bacterium]